MKKLKTVCKRLTITKDSKILPMMKSKDKKSLFLNQSHKEIDDFFPFRSSSFFLILVKAFLLRD